MKDGIIDFHTHSLLSDGELLPAELAQRALRKGYRVLSITDHVDFGNFEWVIKALLRVARQINRHKGIQIIAGVEITHIIPDDIPRLIKECRKAGAQLVNVHGETVAEPVSEGTNQTAIAGKCDLLAHPGLITAEDVKRSVRNNVVLELSARKGHCLTNGQVAALAKRFGAQMVVNTDGHAPADLFENKRQEQVALGAGLTVRDLKWIEESARRLFNRVAPIARG